MGGKSKPPAFQMYAGDWMRDQKVILMSNAGRGVYIHLLCSQWLEGTLPDDTEALARICTTPIDEFSAVWPEVEGCFDRVTRKRTGESKTFLINKRLEVERKKKQKYHKEQSEKGKKGAEKRHGNKEPASSGHDSATAQAQPNDSSSSSISSPTSIDKIDIDNDIDDKSKEQESGETDTPSPGNNTTDTPGEAPPESTNGEPGGDRPLSGDTMRAALAGLGVQPSAPPPEPEPPPDTKHKVPEHEKHEIRQILTDLETVDGFARKDIESYWNQIEACGYGLRHFRHAYTAWRDAKSRTGDDRVKDKAKYFQRYLTNGPGYGGR